MRNIAGPFRPRISYWAAAGVLLIYYFYFASLSFRAGLSGDDYMNLYNAMRVSWPTLIKQSLLFFVPSDTFRPVGALFYKVCHALFGFQPLPLHIVSLLLQTGALYFLFRFAWTLSRSLETALAAALLLCHHSERTGYYLNAGFCYDHLCALFYFGCLFLYVSWRDAGEPIAGEKWCRLALLFALALSSKEMAVSMPAVLITLELTRPTESRDWRFAIASLLMVALYLAGRILVQDGLIHVSGYSPEPSFPAYLRTLSHWLELLFFESGFFPWVTAGVLALLAVTTWIARERTLLAGLVLFSIGVLPVSFIEPMRGLEQVFIPVAGLGLILAWWITRLSLLVAVRRRFTVMFFLLAILLADAHSRHTRATERAMLAEGRFRNRVRQAWEAPAFQN